jgi:replication factor A1
MQRFKVACVVIDGEDVADFMLVDKITKNLFGSFANNYVYDKQFCDPSIVVPQMVAKLDKN